ncbi:MAG: PAS domain S-box protein, partial [Hyphomicrobium sp.]
MSEKSRFPADGKPVADLRAKRAEEELRRSETRIAAMLAIAADAIVSLDDEMRITLFNKGAEDLFGYTQDEILGRSLDTLIPERFRSRHRKDVRDFANSTVPSRRMAERQVIYGLRKDGTEFPAEASIAKLQAGGERIYMAMVRDVSERKQAEDMLARTNADLEARVEQRTKALEEEIQRREKAQAALIQAQRMEAFGQLTGGIAHDFNNLLTIVLGNLELLEAQLSQEKERALLRRAADAGQMGARLTSRLLTFARRQRLEAVVLNLNDLMLGIAELLKRSLGERITLTTVLAGALWPTRADPSEVENAVLNLAINARDAMPDGGKLVIETRNVTVNKAGIEAPGSVAAGDYVRISVTDTGTGMSPEVLEHAFEPFFTTKRGRGTGLGLSTIYGFAQQSGGHVTIDSEPGSGTMVSLFLPRASDVETEIVGQQAPKVPLSENCETVLVVEDDPELRELTLQRVEGLGYVALEAEDAEAAKHILEREPGIELVFSDIVFGRGMSGYQLGLWVRANRPRQRVLLTTGYASDAAGGENIANEFYVLRKPYSRLQLALALKAALKAEP